MLGRKPVVLVTVGDPGGIGPEVAVKALTRAEVRRACHPVMVGSAGVVEDAMRLAGCPARLQVGQAGELGHLVAAAMDGSLALIDTDCLSPKTPTYGVVRPEYGAAAFAYVRQAIELCMAGKAGAVATGPICKEALQLAGYRYSGHTEIFAGLTRTERYCMMLVMDSLRVAHVTTHVALRDVPALITPGRVAEVVRLTAGALRRLGVMEPHIAVAGLNPHAGESGLFGDEERHIREALAACRQEGTRVSGPLPADTVFVRARAGEFAAVVAMYHDQGHIPVKLLGFRVNPVTGRWEATSGVNVTLGLPIVRTSVDHGVAFDIAGQGKADPGSMVDALLLAARLAAPEAD